MIPDGYRIIVQWDGEGEHFVARVPELKGVQATGDSRADAMTNIIAAIEDEIKKAVDEERELPPPIDSTEFAGEITIKLSPSLHRELVYLAKEENIDPHKLAAELLTVGLTQRIYGRMLPANILENNEEQEQRENHKGPQRRRRPRKNYHNIMDDRAAFIEYVRSIEGGSKRGGSGGRNRGRGRK